MFRADLVISESAFHASWCNSIAKGELSNICFTVYKLQHKISNLRFSLCLI